MSRRGVVRCKWEPFSLGWCHLRPQDVSGWPLSVGARAETGRLIREHDGQVSGWSRDRSPRTYLWRHPTFPPPDVTARTRPMTDDKRACIRLARYVSGRGTPAPEQAPATFNIARSLDVCGSAGRCNSSSATRNSNSDKRQPPCHSPATFTRRLYDVWGSHWEKYGKNIQRRTSAERKSHNNAHR